MKPTVSGSLFDYRRVPLELAECRDEPAELFFSVSGDVQRAKSICQRCQVKEGCLAYALETPQLYGIWGGFSAAERVLMRRELRQTLVEVG